MTKLPTEQMCDAARGFIMGLDLGIRKWGAMLKHLIAGGWDKPARLLYMAAEYPDGHITKWDVAECIWQLMSAKQPPIVPEDIIVAGSPLTLEEVKMLLDRRTEPRTTAADRKADQ